jgi:hypothetical protein
MHKSKAGQKKPAKPGPKPDTLKIEGDWQRAVKRSLGKRKPPKTQIFARPSKKEKINNE